VCYLLHPRELPSQAARSSRTSHAPHDAARGPEAFFDELPKDAHPMAVCAAAVNALSTFYQGRHGDATSRTGSTAIRLLAKMPTIAAYSYKHSIGQPFMYPSNDLSYAGNFLHMMFATRASPTSSTR
jgi:citrate synthase